MNSEHPSTVPIRFLNNFQQQPPQSQHQAVEEWNAVCLSALQAVEHQVKHQQHQQAATRAPFGSRSHEDTQQPAPVARTSQEEALLGALLRMSRVGASDGSEEFGLGCGEEPSHPGMATVHTVHSGSTIALSSLPSTPLHTTATIAATTNALPLPTFTQSAPLALLDKPTSFPSVPHEGRGIILPEPQPRKPNQSARKRRSLLNRPAHELSKYKTQMCSNILRGYCEFGDLCIFAHHKTELREELPSSPTAQKSQPSASSTSTPPTQPHFELPPPPPQFCLPAERTLVPQSLSVGFVQLPSDNDVALAPQILKPRFELPETTVTPDFPLAATNPIHETTHKDTHAEVLEALFSTQQRPDASVAQPPTSFSSLVSSVVPPQPATSTTTSTAHDDFRALLPMIIEMLKTISSLQREVQELKALLAFYGLPAPNALN